MHYGKAAETVRLNGTTMQNTAQAKREYKLKKIMLAEQERLEAAKMELNEVKVVAYEYTINARNQ
jgi:hypothetical protein